MLNLTEEQLRQLAQLEERQFVEQVARDIIQEHPELGIDDSLRSRLDAAHGEALALGFTQRPAITQFLYTEAFAPKFSQHPAVATWLRTPRGTVEERFADLLAVMKLHLREQT